MQLLPTGPERVARPTAWYAIDSHTGFSGHACIARLFDLTGHFVQYRDAEDLERQFAVSERRAAIGAAAQAIVLGRHTYDHRAAGIVARMRAALVGDGAGEAGHSGKRMRE